MSNFNTSITFSPLHTSGYDVVRYLRVPHEQNLILTIEEGWRDSKTILSWKNAVNVIEKQIKDASLKSLAVTLLGSWTVGHEGICDW